MGSFKCDCVFLGPRLFPDGQQSSLTQIRWSSESHPLLLFIFLLLHQWTSCEFFPEADTFFLLDGSYFSSSLILLKKFGLIQEKVNLPSCTWCSTSLQMVNTIIVPKLPQLKPSVDVTQKWWDENDSLCPVQCGVLRFLGWDVRSAYTVIKAPSLGVTVAMPRVDQAKSGLFLRKCYHKS